MTKFPLILSAALLAAAPAVAQDKPAAAATADMPTEAQLKAGSETLSLIVSALNSKEVPQETKNGLFGCLYQNQLGKLSDGLTKVLADNKQIDATNPTQRLLVLAKMCGAPLPTAKEGADAAKPAAGAKPAAPAKRKPAAKRPEVWRALSDARR